MGMTGLTGGCEGVDFDDWEAVAGERCAEVQKKRNVHVFVKIVTKIKTFFCGLE